MVRYAEGMHKKIAALVSGVALLSPAFVLAQTALLPTAEFTSQKPFTTKFTIGDKVQVVEGPLRERTKPTTASDIHGVQQAGAKGILRDGPAHVDGHVWWFVDYDSGPDGWSAEEFLGSMRLVNTDAAAQVAALQAALQSILEQIRFLKAQQQ